MMLPGLESYADQSLCPYFPEFFTKDGANALLQRLEAALPWGHAPEYFVAGECRKLSHETVWFGVDIHTVSTKCDVRSADPELRQAAYIRFTPYSDTFRNWQSQNS